MDLFVVFFFPEGGGRCYDTGSILHGCLGARCKCFDPLFWCVYLIQRQFQLLWVCSLGARIGPVRSVLIVYLMPVPLSSTCSPNLTDSIPQVHFHLLILFGLGHLSVSVTVSSVRSSLWFLLGLTATPLLWFQRALMLQLTFVKGLFILFNACNPVLLFCSCKFWWCFSYA